MGTFKVIISMSLIGLLFSSCENKDITSMDDTELVELRRECEMLREDRAKALENNVEAQELIDNILTTINSISGRITILERSHENNIYLDNRKKAEEIANDIVAIQEKLSRAEKLENIDKSTKIIISKLKTTLEQKQREMNELNSIIREKEEQIRNLNNQVSNLDNSLTSINQRLRESNAELAKTREKLRESEINSWINMGDELISAARSLPYVKGHGNMKPIKKAKLTFIIKAINCYRKAYELGSTIASSKIDNAESFYRYNL